MPKILTHEQVRQYAEEGASYPIRVLPPAEARSYLAALEESERTRRARCTIINCRARRGGERRVNAYC